MSRTLQACGADTVEALKAMLAGVSQPFIDHEVMLALRDRGVLIYDADLTERLSPTRVRPTQALPMVG